jgi:coenzyme F420-0:L-glutamate ligase/coenzyme F420-1:gamma-L-glutamate ligase
MLHELPVSRVIASRRSVRRFAPQAVDGALVREIVALACAAPAPHHSRPWRFVHAVSTAAREALAEAMAEAWLADLRTDGAPLHKIASQISRSRSRLLEAPALLLACLLLDEARQWPDARRQQAERDMFVQSLGAALQNMLLAAHERGLVGYLKGAPLFCGQTVREALSLPSAWEPAFLVLLGYPDPTFQPPPRPPLELGEFLIER